MVYPCGKQPLGKQVDLGHLRGLGLAGLKDSLQGDQAAKVYDQIERVTGRLTKADLMIAHLAFCIYRKAGASVILRPLHAAVYKLGAAKQLGGYQSEADKAPKALHQAGAY